MSSIWTPFHPKADKKGSIQESCMLPSARNASVLQLVGVIFTGIRLHHVNGVGIVVIQVGELIDAT
jgi:hypothetical protein